MDVVKGLYRHPLCPLSRGIESHAVQCHVAARLEGCFKKYFKHSSFRVGQLASAAAVLHGRDAFVRMAAGAGKSLCMFLAPLAVSDAAMAVVTSPLLGLMDQQVSYPVCHAIQTFTCMYAYMQVSQLLAVGVPAVRAGQGMGECSDACKGKFGACFSINGVIGK